MSGKDIGDPPLGHEGDGPPSTATARMREAITAVMDGTGSRGQLREAARELVNELRQREHLPEQTLLRIKEILADAGLRPSYAAQDPHEPHASATGLPNEADVYREVISSSIRYYYEGQK